MYTKEQKKIQPPKAGKSTGSYSDTALSENIPNSVMLSMMGRDHAGPQMDLDAIMKAKMQALSSREITASRIKDDMSRHYGVDMSGVRVFQDDGLADVSDPAYVRGNEIHLDSKAFAPGTAAAHNVIMHEAAHVIQQGTGRVSGDIVRSAPLEAEADRAAMTGSISTEGFAMPSAVSAPMQGLFGFGKKKSDNPSPNHLSKLGRFSRAGFKERKEINEKIKNYNKLMYELEHGEEADKNQKLNEASQQYLDLYKQVGALVDKGNNSSAISKLSQQLMLETMDINEKSDNKEFREGWAQQFAGLQKTNIGQNIFGNLFKKRHAVNPNDRRKLTIQNYTEGNKGINAPDAGAVGPNEKEAYAKMGNNGKLIMGKGSDSLVTLPSLEYADFFKKYGKRTGSKKSQETGKAMAAHEFMHSLHHMNGMALDSGIKADSNQYQTIEKDNDTSLEELATTMVRNRKEGGVDSKTYMSNLFEDNQKAREIYNMNESELRNELDMMELYGYSVKHDKSQIGSNGITDKDYDSFATPYNFGKAFAAPSATLKWDEVHRAPLPNQPLDKGTYFDLTYENVASAKDSVNNMSKNFSRRSDKKFLDKMFKNIAKTSARQIANDKADGTKNVSEEEREAIRKKTYGEQYNDARGNTKILSSMLSKKMKDLKK